MIFSCFFIIAVFITKSQSAWQSDHDKRKGFQTLLEHSKEAINTKLNAVEDWKFLKWKNGHVPYRFSDNLSFRMKSAIENAIKTWNSDFKNCIKWSHRRHEKDYVLFILGPMCHSEVGRIKGTQAIVLNDMGCHDQGSILHEMMHAIGFTHEHNRPDRDEYIKINFLNIPIDWRRQYLKEKDWSFGKLGPYDYYSLMHYQVQSPDRKKPAFRVLKHGIDERRIGQMKYLTERDKGKIRNLYCR